MRTDHMNVLLGLGVLWVVALVAAAVLAVQAAQVAAGRVRAGLAAWRSAAGGAVVSLAERMRTAGCFEVFAQARRLAA